MQKRSKVLAVAGLALGFVLAASNAQSRFRERTDLFGFAPDETATRLPAATQKPKTPDPKAAETQAGAAPAEEAHGTYSVGPGGRSLSEIALELYGKIGLWKEIAAWNGIAAPYRIYRGQRLVLRLAPTLTPKEGAARLTALRQLRAQRGRGIAGTQDAWSYTVNTEARSLSEIAHALYSHTRMWLKIADWNNLEAPYRIHLGQKLLLRKTPANPAAPGTLARIPAPAEQAHAREIASDLGQKYLVHEGAPCLSLIALEVYGSSKQWKKIAEWNGITDPRSIYIGQHLVLKDAPGSTSARDRAEAARSQARPPVDDPL